MREQNLLTRSEFQVMKILWNLPGNGGFTGDILEKYEDPKPAYTTLATFLKILSNKGYVNIQKRGNKLFYKPQITKEEYAVTSLSDTKNIFFEGSVLKMFQFFLSNEKISEEEVNKIIQLVREKQA